MVNSICVSLSIYRYIIYFNIYDVLYMYACGIYGTTRYMLLKWSVEEKACEASCCAYGVWEEDVTFRQFASPGPLIFGW